VLVVGSAEPFWIPFRKRLHELGYIEGKNIVFELRPAEGKQTLLPDLAAELVRLAVDVIVASQTPAVHAAKRATNQIPIIMAPAGDPVGTGLIASLARPGGNVSGLSANATEIAGKCLEIIREMLPKARRVAVLANSTDPFAKPFLEELQIATRTVGFDFQTIMIRGAEEFDVAFGQIDREQVAAVIIQPSLRPRMPAIDLARKYGLPSVSPTSSFIEEGGLMSYAASNTEQFREAAVYVDKILKGSKPADLPVQQPTKFELGINFKTAKELGLTLPPTLVARADMLIE